MIKMLVGAKANIQSRNSDTGYVPLHDAAFSGSFEAVKQLLELNAPHLPRTVTGKTPLRLAMENGYTEIVNYLGKIQTIHLTLIRYLYAYLA